MMFNFRTKKLERNAVVFTTHKAGSMLLHRVLQDICRKNSIPYYSPNEVGDKSIPFERIFRGEDFMAARNGCFGALRFFLTSATLRSANIVLHLRDPRDVLTSMFYSYCYMHPAKYPGEIEVYTGYRKEVADAGIDKFVIDMTDENYASYRGSYGTGGNFGAHIGNVRHRYDVYLRELVGQPNVVVVSYEEMVLDFAGWLKKVVAAFQLERPEKTYDLIMRDHSESVKADGEDIWSHKRKVLPGDHKEKLKPTTIAELNERFRDALEVLGYSSAQYEQTGIPSMNLEAVRESAAK